MAHAHLDNALLAAIKANLLELERLLGSVSDHWGYEDPVYRFYHQSFKVYDLQRSTGKIVDALRGLMPASGARESVAFAEASDWPRNLRRSQPSVEATTTRTSRRI